MKDLEALLTEYNLDPDNLPARGELDAAVKFFEQRLADCDPWAKPGHARSLAYVKARRVLVELVTQNLKKENPLPESTDNNEWSEVESLPFQDNHLLVIFAYDEGAPIRFLRRDDDFNLFVWNCVERNLHNSRWTVFQAEAVSMMAYFQREDHMLSVLRNAVDGKIYIVDMQDNHVQSAIHQTTLNDLPESYTPTDAAYYYEKIADWIDYDYIGPHSGY